MINCSFILVGVNENHVSFDGFEVFEVFDSFWG
jgi:hypothetical protein